MHGPDGQNYPNECVFAEILPPHRVVIDHVVYPRFHLTITLSSMESGTNVTWLQSFEDQEFAQQVAEIVIPANEQNLDRLTAEVVKPNLIP